LRAFVSKEPAEVVSMYPETRECWAHGHENFERWLAPSEGPKKCLDRRFVRKVSD
jgi:hypothetical protein